LPSTTTTPADATATAFGTDIVGVDIGSIVVEDDVTAECRAVEFPSEALSRTGRSSAIVPVTLLGGSENFDSVMFTPARKSLSEFPVRADDELVSARSASSHRASAIARPRRNTGISAPGRNGPPVEWRYDIKTCRPDFDPAAKSLAAGTELKYWTFW
jgi:hypothetical protein